MVFRGRFVAALLLLTMFASFLIGVSVSGNLTFTTTEDAETIGPVSGEQALQLAKNAGMTDQQLAKWLRAYQLIQQKYYQDVDGEKMVNGAIQGMVTVLDDPFSSYMDQVQAKQFEESLDASFEGIGADVAMRDGKVVVISPIKGSPAEKAGLHANDEIISVNGEKLEGLSLYDAVQKIRGKKGTQAKLTINRPGVSESLQIIVVRDKISVDTVYSQMLASNIGKIEITQFSRDTAERFAEHLTKLEDQGLKGLIIDVRNNPGGLLPSVIEISNHFIDSGKPIVSLEYTSEKPKQVTSNGSAKKYPIVVLINNGSASASEILAGALKDSAQSILMGEKSFGKGTVQNTFEQEMGDGSDLKLTIGKWLTPNGTWVHKNGIKPDIEVSQPDYFKVASIDPKKGYRLNSNSEDIKNAQIMLSATGFDPKRKDGYFDINTENALKQFQKNEGINESGILDEPSVNKLQDRVRNKISDPMNDLQLQEAIRWLQKR